MIINSSIISDRYKCGKQVARYLMIKCFLPILSYDGNSYYFANTEKLKTSLQTMPLYLKILAGLTSEKGVPM